MLRWLWERKFHKTKAPESESSRERKFLEAKVRRNEGSIIHIGNRWTTGSKCVALAAVFSNLVLLLINHSVSKLQQIHVRAAESNVIIPSVCSRDIISLYFVEHLVRSIK